MSLGSSTPAFEQVKQLSTAVFARADSRMKLDRISLSIVLRCAFPALLLSAVCLLPYLSKAFTIDDPFFLLQAQQIRRTPLNPTAMEICWTVDNGCGPVAKSGPSNLLMSYY